MVPWAHGVDVLRAFVRFAVGSGSEESEEALARLSGGSGVWPEVLALLESGTATGIGAASSGPCADAIGAPGREEAADPQGNILLPPVPKAVFKSGSDAVSNQAQQREAPQSDCVVEGAGDATVAAAARRVRHELVYGWK